MLSPRFPHAFNTQSPRFQQAFPTHSIRFPLPWRCLGCRRRRQGVLPKSHEAQKVGRALRCAPPEAVKTPAFRTSAGAHGAHGVLALPAKPFGQHARQESQTALHFPPAFPHFGGVSRQPAIPSFPHSPAALEWYYNVEHSQRHFPTKRALPLGWNHVQAVLTLCTSLVGALYRPCTRFVPLDAHRMYTLCATPCTGLVQAWGCFSSLPYSRSSPLPTRLRAARKRPVIPDFAYSAYSGSLFWPLPQAPYSPPQSLRNGFLLPF